MKLLKQSTTVTIKIGPFLDASDGVSEETALTPGIEVSKDGGAFAARNSATAVAHDAEGWYDVELDGTDTGTLGPLVVKAHDSATHLPVYERFMVVPAHVYDGLVPGTDFLQVDAQQVGGAAPDGATDIADQVWEEALADHSGTSGSVAEEIASHALSTEISALNDISAADVLAETLSELSQGQPSATPSLADAIMLLYMAMRNEETQTSSEYAVKDDSGTVVAKASVSDDGSEVTKGKMVSGP